MYYTGWSCADPTGLFDAHNNRWAESLLVKVDIRLDQFPEVFPPGTILGSITPVAAEACGLPVGLPVEAAYQLQTPNYEGMAHRYDLKVSGVESMIPFKTFVLLAE